MKTRFYQTALCGFMLGLVLTGCATKPYDYTNYRAHPPRSILVLPPLNESTDIRGSYSYLSTITMPIAERGYYVFPVAIMDQLFKENGMPTPGEMHQAPLNKILEIVGADAVLYITLKQYGSKYQLLTSSTTVQAQCKLVDIRTGALLWDGTVMAQESSGGQGGGGLIGAVVGQIVNQATDHARDIARIANGQFAVKDHGLLIGPYHPQFGKQ
jgi:hypothetical protein